MYSPKSYYIFTDAYHIEYRKEKVCCYIFIGHACPRFAILEFIYDNCCNVPLRHIKLHITTFIVPNCLAYILLDSYLVVFCFVIEVRGG